MHNNEGGSFAIMKTVSIAEELKNNSYPGRGIIIGRTPDGKKAVTAYFIMGRSENSRNRVFVEEGEGIRTQAFDPAKLEDPSLIIYAPVRIPAIVIHMRMRSRLQARDISSTPICTTAIRFRASRVSRKRSRFRTAWMSLQLHSGRI